MNKQILRSVVFAGLFIVPFIPFFVSSSFFFPFITTKAFAWRVIVEIVFAAWILLALMAPEYRPKKSIILYAFALFLAIIGLSDLLGAAPLKSLWSNYERMEGFVSLLHLGAFFLVISSVFRETDWKHWWNTTLAASFLMVIYCAFQLAGSIQIHQGGVRVDGTLGNATYLAVYMLFHIFIALLFFWREKSQRWLYGTLIILEMWVLYYTATRGAILGLIGGLLLAALLNIKSETLVVRRASLGILAALVVIVGAFFALRESSFIQNSPVLSRFANISTEELKGGGRSFVWPMALKGMKERPILGWGQDNFNYVFNEHYDPKMYMLEPWFDRAHNIFLDWGVAGGLLGLLSYLSLYAAFLCMLWRKENPFAHEERSILTALLAAYFFHNFFVFDQLVSYFLFAALLAYVHSQMEARVWPSFALKENALHYIATPLVVATLLASLYWVNVKPIMANSTLIDALSLLQASPANHSLAVSKFKRAHGLTRLGRPETVEQIAAHANTILSGPLSTEEKNDFYRFAKEAVVRQASESSGDARYEVLAGVFLAQTGAADEGIEHLKRALELMPGKQLVYFELGSALLNKGDSSGALSAFRVALELAPEYVEAKKIYFIGAIYAADRSLESELLSQFEENEIIFDDRVISAYYAKKRIADVVRILERRIELDPANAENYRNIIRQLPK